MVQQQSGGSMPLPSSAEAPAASGTPADEVALRRAASFARQLRGALPLDSSGANDHPDDGADDENDGDHDSADMRTVGRGPNRAVADGDESEDGTAAARDNPTDGSVWADHSPAGSGDGPWEEAPLMQDDCELIWRGGVVPGSLRLSRSELYVFSLAFNFRCAPAVDLN